MDSIWLMLGLMLAIAGSYALIERKNKKEMNKQWEENDPYYRKEDAE